MKRADPKKKSPPKEYMVTAGMTKLGFSRLFSKHRVPKKYMAPPTPANKSTQKPLSSSYINSRTLLPYTHSPRHNFQACDSTTAAEPSTNKTAPSHARSNTGMNMIDPTRQSSDPKAERRKLILSVRKGQPDLVQCSHSVTSASRKVNEPIVYSQADTSAVSMYSLAKGYRMNDPKRNVPPPMKQLTACQSRQIRLFSTVDLTYI